MKMKMKLPKEEIVACIRKQKIHNFFAEDCTIYASELTCYYRPSERICVLPKGKTHKTKWRIL